MMLASDYFIKLDTFVPKHSKSLLDAHPLMLTTKEIQNDIRNKRESFLLPFNSCYVLILLSYLLHG